MNTTHSWLTFSCHARSATEGLLPTWLHIYYNHGVNWGVLKYFCPIRRACKKVFRLGCFHNMATTLCLLGKRDTTTDSKERWTKFCTLHFISSLFSQPTGTHKRSCWHQRMPTLLNLPLSQCLSQWSGIRTNLITYFIRNGWT